MKKLFTLVAMAFCGMAMFAGTWEKPVITADMYIPFIPGDSVYIYNTKSNLFLTEGNNWGTHASVGDAGLLFTIEKYMQADEWDGKTYLIKDLSIAKNSWKEMFIDNGSDVYVDRGSQANYYWQVQDFGNYLYGFFGADINPEYNLTNYPDYFLGHCTTFRNEKDGVDTGTGVIVANPADYGEGATYAGDLYITWALISQASYATYGAKLEAYVAAEALAAKIEEAKAAGVSTAAAEAVYGNTDSTAEELKAATDALTQAIIEDAFGKATPDNPANMTDKIINHDFANGDCTTGWSGDAFGRGGTVADGAEMYDKDFDAYQDIEGLHAGIYRVGVQAFYRAGAASADYQNFVEDDLGTRNAKLYAVNGQDVESSVGIVHLASGAEAENKSGGDEVSCGEGLYVSNSMAAADYHFNTLDKYHNEVLCEVTEDGKLRIGARKNLHIATDWSIFDNFSLFFYGDSDEAYKLWLEETVKNLPQYDFETLFCYTPMKESYQAVVEAIQGASTKDEIKAAIASLNATLDDFNANVTVYEQYKAKVDALRAELESGTEYICDEGYILVDYIMEGNEMEPYDEMPNGSFEYIYGGGTLDTEAMKAEIAWLDALYQAAVANSLQPGQDCTNLLINPNFAYADGRGWQNPNKVTSISGGLSSYPCAEAYEMAFDVYQIVNDLPNGIYKVTANAFYRPGANGTFDGTEEVPAQIYFNEFSAPVQHILADHSETELFNDGSWMADYMYSDGIYIPNSMNGASTYFLQGKYLQEVYGLVENGTMRLGIRSTATSGAGRWCLWTNFKLIYVGKDAEALSEILPVYIEKADVLLADGSYMSTEAKSGLEAAIATATAASDADSMFDALVGLNTALSTANASVAAYGDLATVVEELSTAIDWYAPTCSEEAQNAALALIDEVSTALVAGSYTDEEATAKCDDVKAAIAALKVPAIEPTDEEPADFTEWIVNPAFDEAVADGWDITISDKSNYGYQGASYSNGSVTISQFIEVWRSGNAPLGDGDICQTIYYLPEGTYTLGCDIVANQQDGVTETTGVYLFAEQSDGVTDSLEVATGNGLPEHFEVTFTKKAGTAVTIGVRCASTTANWLAADNWTLTYFGKHSDKNPDFIETVAQPETPVVIYDLFGRRLNALQPGINIVNGKKVLVK